jgi:transcriptional regulator with XRE-family HTH domain
MLDLWPPGDTLPGDANGSITTRGVRARYVTDIWRVSGRRYRSTMAWQQPYRDPQRQHGFDLIGEMVKARRYKLGWSQRYLEALSGIDQTVISRIENGKQYGLRWLRFADLVDALGGLECVSTRPDSPERAPFGVRKRDLELSSPAPIPTSDWMASIEDLDERYGLDPGTTDVGETLS